VTAPIVAGERRDERQAEGVAVEATRLLGIMDRDDDVIQPEPGGGVHRRRIGWLAGANKRGGVAAR
jgi:hypothetical protein